MNNEEHEIIEVGTKYGNSTLFETTYKFVISSKNLKTIKYLNLKGLIHITARKPLMLFSETDGSIQILIDADRETIEFEFGSGQEKQRSDWVSAIIDYLPDGDKNV